MTLFIFGFVVGYGLALVVAHVRSDRSCVGWCTVVRFYRAQREHQDVQIAALFSANERLARQIVVQAACDKTRQMAP